MKLKCLLLLMLLTLLLCGRAAYSTAGSQEATKGKKTPPTSQQSRSAYSSDLAEVRAQFNRDKGKVRLVTLLSPT